MALNSRAAGVAETDPASFGAGTGFVYTVNTTVGAGFLGLPWAYLQGGWLLCVLVQVAIALLSWLMSLMLLEVMSRAEAVTRLREEGYNIPSLGYKHLCGKKVYDNDLYLIPNTHKPEITHRRFDLTELVRIYFGEK